MLIIYPKSGDCHIINTTYTHQILPIAPSETCDIIILVAEGYLCKSGNNIYYVFDCIKYGDNINMLPFIGPNGRLKYIQQSV